MLHCKRLLRVSTAVAQSLHDSPFQLVYSSSGLISSKRVHDKYEMCKLMFSSEAASPRSRFQGKETLNS